MTDKTDYTAVPKKFYFDTNYDRPQHDYFFEIVEGERETVLATIKCPYARMVEAEVQPAVVLTWTTDSQYEEHSGIRRRVFNVGGRSGATPADLANFKRFLNFWEELATLKAENVSAFARARDIRLVLNFPYEGESYYCNIVRGVSYRRDRNETTFSFTYSLTVMTTGYVARNWTVANRLREFLETNCGDKDDSCHTGRRHPCRRMAELSVLDMPDEDDPLKGLPELVVPLCDEIEENGGLRSPRTYGTYQRMYIVGSCGYEAATLWWLALSVEHQDRLFYKKLAITGWVSNLLMEAKVAVGMRGGRFEQRIDNYCTVGQWGGVRNSWQSRYAYVGADRDIPAFPPFVDGPNPLPANYIRPPSSVPSREVTLQESDHSVIALSRRLFGDATYASTILELNPSLANLNTWRTGQSLGLGDVLKVPRVGGTVSGTGPSLGVDWKVVDGDFVWDDDAGDFVRVAHKECYDQNTRHRLSTPFNANKAFPGTGITVPRGDDGELRAEDAASAVQVQVLLDTRTDRILRMSADEEPPVVFVHVEIQLVSGEQTVESYQAR